MRGGVEHKGTEETKVVVALTPLRMSVEILISAMESGRVFALMRMAGIEDTGGRRRLGTLLSGLAQGKVGLALPSGAVVWCREGDVVMSKDQTQPK